MICHVRGTFLPLISAPAWLISCTALVAKLCILATQKTSNNLAFLFLISNRIKAVIEQKCNVHNTDIFCKAFCKRMILI